MLADLQQWMQATILSGQGAHVPAHVRGSNRLGAEERMGIYVRAYRLRLIECLREEFRVLAALAGPTAFDLFAQGYIAARPSTSYTLYDLGAGFAGYLEAARPVGDDDPTGVGAIPAALARIERARAEAMRARGVEDAGPTGNPILSLLGLTRHAVPDSVHLFDLPFDFTETIASVEAGEAPAPPRRVAWTGAVARARYRVAVHTLDRAQHDWLMALGEGEAPDDPAIRDWLPQAVARGLVVEI